jgi:muconolactone delta-isomerase
MVVATPNADVERQELQAAETDAVQALRRSGIIEQIFVRGDGSASLTVLEAVSEDEARAHIEALPFFKAGAMSVDIFDIRVL